MLIDMPEADVLEILDDTGTFNEQEWIGTVQFALLPSTSFLCLVDSKPKFKTPQLEPVELLPADFERFRSLKNGADKLQSAMKLFKKQTSGRLAVYACSCWSGCSNLRFFFAIYASFRRKQKLDTIIRTFWSKI